jgi:hypothetical protein
MTAEERESAKRYADKMRQRTAVGLPGAAADWIDGLADALAAAEARIAELESERDDEHRRRVRGMCADIATDRDRWQATAERLGEAGEGLAQELRTGTGYMSGEHGHRPSVFHGEGCERCTAAVALLKDWRAALAAYDERRKDADA